MYSRNFTRSLPDAKRVIHTKPVGSYVFFENERKHGMLFKSSDTHTFTYEINPNQDYSVYIISIRNGYAMRYTSIDKFIKDLDRSGKDYDMIRDVEMHAGTRTHGRGGEGPRIGSVRRGVQRGIFMGANLDRPVHPRVREIRASAVVPARIKGACATGYAEAHGMGNHTGVLTRKPTVSRSPGGNSEASELTGTPKVSRMLQSMRLSEQDRDRGRLAKCDVLWDHNYENEDSEDHDYENVDSEDREYEDIEPGDSARTCVYYLDGANGPDPDHPDDEYSVVCDAVNNDDDHEHVYSVVYDSIADKNGH